MPHKFCGTWSSPRLLAHLQAPPLLHTHLQNIPCTYTFVGRLGTNSLSKAAYVLLGHRQQERPRVHDGLAALAAPAGR